MNGLCPCTPIKILLSTFPACQIFPNSSVALLYLLHQSVLLVLFCYFIFFFYWGLDRKTSNPRVSQCLWILPFLQSVIIWPAGREQRVKLYGIWQYWYNVPELLQNDYRMHKTFSWGFSSKGHLSHLFNYPSRVVFRYCFPSLENHLQVTFRAVWVATSYSSPSTPWNLFMWPIGPSFLAQMDLVVLGTKPIGGTPSVDKVSLCWVTGSATSPLLRWMSALSPWLPQW